MINNYNQKTKFIDVTEEYGLFEPLRCWEFSHSSTWGNITKNGYPDLKADK